MKVSLSTYGGLVGGLGLPGKVVEDAQLDPADQAELRALVAAATAATGSSQESGKPRDAQTYEIVIEDDGRCVTLEATDGNVPAAFADLRDWIRNR